MGLDMYLKAEKYVSNWDFRSDEERKFFHDVLTGIKVPAHLVDEGSPGIDIQITVGYWRKANAIHAWFVREVQDGKDECLPHYVPREKLTELRGLCEKVLKAKGKKNAAKVANDLLPPQQGFFFGNTELDEWYYDGLKRTIEIVDRVLNEPSLKDCDILYRSSW